MLTSNKCRYNNTEGTNVVMSSNNIQHIFNEHGKEYRKGQIDDS